MTTLLKYLTLFGLCLLALILLAVPLSILERPGDLRPVDNTQDILLENAHIIDVAAGEVIAGQKLLLSGGRIRAIGADLPEKRQGLRIIDLHGAYVMPGLFDMHVHLHDRKYLGTYLAHGVTTVRNMRGLPMHLRWKRELAAGEWLGSNLITSSPVLDGEKYAHALQQVVVSPERARELVRQYHEDGYDLIKAYGYLDKDVFSAIIEQAQVLDFPVAKHGPNPVEGLELASNGGLQSLEHVEDIFQGPLNFSFDHGAMVDWVRALKALDPAVTPTLATFHHLVQLSRHKGDFVDTLPLDTLNPLYRRMNREFTVKRWLGASEEQAEWNLRVEAFLQQIVAELDRQGFRLLVGSDGGTMYMPPGSSTHLEIQLLAQAGVPAHRILQAATINAATALGISDDYGTIEVDKVADLLVVEGNPLEDVETLKSAIFVIKAGQSIDQAELVALRESGRNPSSFYISLGRLLEDILSRALL
jgi:imidazolonepropionase-like amidohydrolase